MRFTRQPTSSLFIGSLAKLQAVEPVRRISLAQPDEYRSMMQQVEENVTNVGTSGSGALTEEGLPSRALRLCRRGHRSARGQRDNELLPYPEPSTRQTIDLHDRIDRGVVPGSDVI
jgi:hypothetical protein